MCGISGIFQLKKNNKIELLRSVNSIKHRGPDHTGIWSDNNISLGSVRLKVVDLNNSSNQPFRSKNKRFIIVFNGEIYNYLNLKKKFNIKTKTNSDTEVIVELFAKIGPRTFSLLEGMFGLAIYDTYNLKLYLSRDAYGIKPLYYFNNKRKFFFSSEIKGLIVNNKQIKQNDKAIIDFIKWGGLDHSTSTWFKNIFSLEPGSYLEIDRNLLLKKKKYYFLEQEVSKQNIQNINIPLKFKKLLEESVKSQSSTVRSIGSNLSGGVDSSIVTMFLADNNKNIDTYTFGYNEKQYDERKQALKIAKILNVKNYNSVCSAKDINKYFIDTLLMEDEPFTSFRQVSHHKLYNDFKKSGSTVILEASGGDEIGSGYSGFIWPYYLDQVQSVGTDLAWNELLKNLKIKKNDGNFLYNFIFAGIENQKHYGINTSDGNRIINTNCINENYEKKFNFGPPEYNKKFESNLKNSQYIEFFYTKLPRGLRYVDRASSGSGREARVPLLNKKLVEFCFAVPNEYKIKNGQLRWFMRESLRYLKRNFIKLSNKKSIADPQRVWTRKDLKKIFLSLFNSKAFKNRGIFNQKEVLINYDYFLKNPNSHSLGIFQIFITEIWFRLFIDNNPNSFRGAKLDEFVNYTNY